MGLNLNPGSFIVGCRYLENMMLMGLEKVCGLEATAFFLKKLG